MVTDSRIFVYLQRPDTGEWVAVGRYRTDPATGRGSYRYADSYIDAGFGWAIDPVNIPFVPGIEHSAPRYGGLHDVLRDACPDAWGQSLIRRQHGLPNGTPLLKYLLLAGNSDRWGALAVGTNPRPEVARVATPKLHQLDALVRELEAISANKPAVDASLRKKLFATPSMGGARPKASVSERGDMWLVKPSLVTDTEDIALLEHVAQRWGRMAGLNFAETVHHVLESTRSVVRVKRFDRHDGRRLMTVSGASLLGVEYPPVSPTANFHAGYPRLAEELRRIGAPVEDRIELFGRMIFNAIVGNDDDHPRNHAALYDAETRRWRLAPAFDVVPNPDETPNQLCMQLSSSRRDISREAAMFDFARFGFATGVEASEHLDSLLVRIRDSFTMVEHLLPQRLRTMLVERLRVNYQRLLAD